MKASFFACLMALAGCVPAHVQQFETEHRDEWFPGEGLTGIVRPGMTEAALLRGLGEPTTANTSTIGDQTLHHYTFCTGLRRFQTPEGEALYAWWSGAWKPTTSVYHCGGSGGGGAWEVGMPFRVVASNGAVSQVYF